MKLLRIHVDNFGKLNNLELNFQDGLNVIKEPNAWGKSTIAAFIRVMLYGFDAKKAPGALERDRTYYMPWQGGVYGGELDFSVGSRSYRISRTFGATEKKDVCHIYDLETNLESVEFSGNIGEYLFDLDSNSFRRTVFIAQNDCASQTSDAINAKLGNLAENTNDINNYETAQEHLKAIANSLTPNRATGSLKKRKSVLTELEEELRGYDATVEALAQVTEAKKNAIEYKQNLMSKRETMATQLRLASEDSRRTELQKQYLDICSDCVSRLEALNEFAESFPVGAPSEEEFANALKAARAIEEKQLHMEHLAFTESEKELYDKLSSMFGNAIPTDIETDSIINRLNQIGDMREEKSRFDAALFEREKTSMVISPLPDKPKATNGFTVTGIISVVLGLGAFIAALLAFLFKGYAPFYMFVGVGFMLLGTILFFLSYGKQKKDMVRYEVEIKKYKEDQQRQMDEVANLRNQADGKEIEINVIYKEARLFLEKYSIYCGVANYSGALYELKAQVKEYHRLNERYKEYKAAELENRELINALDAFASTWKFSLGNAPIAALIRLQTESAKYFSAAAAAEASNSKRIAFEESNNMADLEIQVTADGTLDDINRQIAEIDESLETARTAIDQYGRQMEELKEQLDQMDEKKAELEDCYEIQREEQNRYEVITMTQQFLSNAREQFTARYMAPISNAFRKYYNQIITNQGDDWVIDANIALKKREMGELRTVDHMSVGFQDLIGVCMRLALVDAMYQEEKPFLILDDPFVNLDEEKTAKGMGLMHFVSNEYQTIYFTCHDSRTPA